MHLRKLDGGFMEKKLKIMMSVFSVGVALTLASCGYTSKTKLPNDIKTIYVETVLNKIAIEQMYSYQPGLEMDITNSVIRRFHVDGNLKIAKADQADAVLSMDLKSYEQEGVRFNPLENVSEYRLFIVLDVTLKNRETGEIIWKEPNFSGNKEYFVTQVRAQGQRAATEKAIEDIAKKVVDRVVEDW